VVPFFLHPEGFFFSTLKTFFSFFPQFPAMTSSPFPDISYPEVTNPGPVPMKPLARHIKFFCDGSFVPMPCFFWGGGGGRRTLPPLFGNVSVHLSSLRWWLPPFPPLLPPPSAFHYDRPFLNTIGSEVELVPPPPPFFRWIGAFYATFWRFLFFS